jgi:hypothetical protein
MILARVLMLAALAGCQGTAQSVVFTFDGGSAADPDAAPQNGPFDITIASAPPIDVTGGVLWLDPKFGIAHTGPEVRAWTDRSGLGLVLARPDGDPGSVTVDQLSDKEAVRFDGRANLTLASTMDPSARAALTIGRANFLIAVVIAEPAGRAPSTLFALAPDGGGAGAARIELDPLRFVLDQGDYQTVLAAPEQPSPDQPHLVMVTAEGPWINLSVDGVIVAERPLGRLLHESNTGVPVELPFENPVLAGPGGGFAGVVGDVVLVVGPGVESSSVPVEAYLRKKYGF